MRRKLSDKRGGRVVPHHDYSLSRSRYDSFGLTCGAVPSEVAQKPAVAGFAEDEQVWVETTTKLPTAARAS